jgi:hypothetical protein
VNAALALSLGLRVEAVLARVNQFAEPVIDFWMVACAASGRELGSWVPATASARVGGTIHKGQTDPDALLRLYAAHLRSPRPRTTGGRAG